MGGGGGGNRFRIASRQDVVDETTRAKAAEAGLGGAAIADEVTRAEAAEGTLGDAITAETARAEAAEALRLPINNLTVGISPTMNFVQGVAQTMTWANRGFLGTSASLNGDTVTIDILEIGTYLIRHRFDLQPQHGSTFVQVRLLNIIGTVFGDLFIWNFPMPTEDGTPDWQGVTTWIATWQTTGSFQIEGTVSGGTDVEEVGDGVLQVVRLN